MAHVLLTKDPQVTHVYNVDAAVGPGCPNRRDDVLLVQYFIKAHFDNPLAFAPPFAPPAPLPPLVVDGIAGPVTFGWILHYQKLVKARGRPIATDGRVDKIAKGQAVGSISNTQYTILWMCNGFRVARPNDYKNIAKATDCPADLAAAVCLL